MLKFVETTIKDMTTALFILLGVLLWCVALFFVATKTAEPFPWPDQPFLNSDPGFKFKN